MERSEALSRSKVNSKSKRGITTQMLRTYKTEMIKSNLLTKLLKNAN